MKNLNFRVIIYILTHLQVVINHQSGDENKCLKLLQFHDIDNFKKTIIDWTFLY